MCVSDACVQIYVCLHMYECTVCACVLHCIFQLSHDRGMQKHDSLGVETICLTCNQLAQCRGVYIEAACLEAIKQARLHKSVSCSSPQSLCSHSIVRFLSQMTWLTCDLWDSPNTLPTSRAKAAQCALISPVASSGCLCVALRWWLCLTSPHSSLQGYLDFWFIGWNARRNVWENEIPALQLWCPATKQAERDCMIPPRRFTSLTARINPACFQTSLGSSLRSCSISCNTRMKPGE